LPLRPPKARTRRRACTLRSCIACHARHHRFRRYIEHHWYVFTPGGAAFDLCVDVFVAARADLIFNFGVPYRRHIVGGRTRRIGHSNLDAQRLRPIRIAQRRDVVVTGMRFHTAGLMPFVSRGVDAWNDRVVSLSQVFGGGALALEQTLRSRPKPRASSPSRCTRRSAGRSSPCSR
jgi:hypothetical protein